MAVLEMTARKQVVEQMLAEIEQGYVFPEVAARIVTQIRSHLAEGAYDDLADAKAFCATVTEHMQAVCGDKHLRLRVRQLGQSIHARSPEEYQQAAALENYGFNKVERLPGNVGYLDLRGFHSPDVAGETAVAAMNLLANSSALIIDLTQCPGGSPGMIQLLTTYLMDARPVHLNSFYFRPADLTMQTWTLPYVPGKRMSHVPVYVLTSSFTFSAAEEFTYNLKNLKRATIVGETTGGGAHPGGSRPLPEGLEVFIPSGRAINPITGTNWEGTGVEPDIAVPKDAAFTTAYRAALEQVLGRIKEESAAPVKLQAAEIEKALAGLR